MDAFQDQRLPFTKPRIQKSLDLLLVSRPNAWGQLRLAPLDPVWSHPLPSERCQRILEAQLRPDSLNSSANGTDDDGQVEGFWLPETMLLFISQRLLLILCYARDSRKVYRIFGKPCAFHYQGLMLF